jgi:YggT family protein
MSSLLQAAFFLVETLFDLWLLALLLRFILQKLNVSFYHPVSQFLVKLTQWLVRPTRQFIKSYRSWDLAILFWLVVFAWLEVVLVYVLVQGAWPPILGSMITGLLSLIVKVVHVYFYALLGRAILSWFPGAGQNPIVMLLWLLTEPFLSRIRRYVKPIAGFDLSLLVFLLLTQILLILLRGWAY